MPEQAQPPTVPEVPTSFPKTVPRPRSFDDMNTGQMVFELQGSVGELKEAIATLARVVDKGFGRLDVVERSSSDVREILRALTPKLDDLAGFTKHKVPALAEKSDLVTLRSELAREIAQRPTRRQAILDIAWIVGLITAAVTFGARLAR